MDGDVADASGVSRFRSPGRPRADGIAGEAAGVVSVAVEAVVLVDSAVAADSVVVVVAPTGEQIYGTDFDVSR